MEDGGQPDLLPEFQPYFIMPIIQTESFPVRASRRPRVFAVFSYRYDAHLVPGLLENLRPAIDGVVSCDDRDGPPGLSDEPARRAALLDAARLAGADWVLAADPDERFEDALADRIAGLVAQGRHVLWTFALREMLSPSTYRIDGVWGGKTQMRLFALETADRRSSKALHGAWVTPRNGLSTWSTGLNLYHFRSATAERRQHRRDLYAAADPDRRWQGIGYDYLADERGLVAEEVAPARRYSPQFVEDGGLWAPPIHLLGQPVVDPVPARLRLMSHLLQTRGRSQAGHVACDLSLEQPDDADLQFLAALLGSERGSGKDDAMDAAAPGDTALAGWLAARRAAAAGNPPRAQALIDALRDKTPQALWLAHGQTVMRDANRLSDPNAAWRDHLTGPARLLEGAQNAAAPLAVIVLSYRAPEHLHRAVASILDQDRPAEVVVVNSGGGDAARVLGDLLPRVRLVDVAERLYVGAARNVGIDASIAPYVAFLAADCVALPGWIAERESHHAAGALSVSTPVTTLHPDNLVCRATNLYNYGRRNPEVDPAEISHFGRSYARSVFGQVGYFPPELRQSEDEVFNMAVDLIEAPVWAPRVLTGHEDPPSAAAALADRLLRGYRMALGPNESAGGRADRPFRLLQNRQTGRVRIADDLIAGLPDVSDADRGRLRRLVRVLAMTEAASYRVGKMRIRLARLLSRTGSRLTDRAVARLFARWSVGLSPQNWRYHLRTGDLDAAGGDLDGAVECYRTASRLAPFSPEPMVNLVSSLCAAGQMDRAQDLLERAIILAPGSAPLRQAAARLAQSRGQGEMALLHAHLALAANPADPAIHDLLAELHDTQGRPALGARRRAMAKDLRRFDANLARSTA